MPDRDSYGDDRESKSFRSETFVHGFIVRVLPIDDMDSSGFAWQFPGDK